MAIYCMDVLRNEYQMVVYFQLYRPPNTSNSQGSRIDFGVKNSAAKYFWLVNASDNLQSSQTGNRRGFDLISGVYLTQIYGLKEHLKDRHRLYKTRLASTCLRWFNNSVCFTRRIHKITWLVYPDKRQIHTEIKFIFWLQKLTLNFLSSSRLSNYSAKRKHFVWVRFSKQRNTSKV